MGTSAGKMCPSCAKGCSRHHTESGDHDYYTLDCKNARVCTVTACEDTDIDENACQELGVTESGGFPMVLDDSHIDENISFVGPQGETGSAASLHGSAVANVGESVALLKAEKQVNEAASQSDTVPTIHEPNNNVIPGHSRSPPPVPPMKRKPFEELCRKHDASGYSPLDTDSDTLVSDEADSDGGESSHTFKHEELPLDEAGETPVEPIPKGEDISKVPDEAVSNVPDEAIAKSLTEAIQISKEPTQEPETSLNVPEEEDILVECPVKIIIEECSDNEFDEGTNIATSDDLLLLPKKSEIEVQLRDALPPPAEGEEDFVGIPDVMPNDQSQGDTPLVNITIETDETLVQDFTSDNPPEAARLKNVIALEMSMDITNELLSNIDRIVQQIDCEQAARVKSKEQTDEQPSTASETKLPSSTTLLDSNQNNAVPQTLVDSNQNNAATPSTSTDSNQTNTTPAARFSDSNQDESPHALPPFTIQNKTTTDILLQHLNQINIATEASPRDTNQNNATYFQSDFDEIVKANACSLLDEAWVQKLGEMSTSASDPEILPMDDQTANSSLTSADQFYTCVTPFDDISSSSADFSFESMREDEPRKTVRKKVRQFFREIGAKLSPHQQQTTQKPLHSQDECYN